MDPWTIVGWCLVALLALPVAGFALFYVFCALVIVVKVLSRMSTPAKLALATLIFFGLAVAAIVAAGGPR